eukprot:symbB.v1.2.029147.t1/scaffold3160.1/size62170/7
MLRAGPSGNAKEYNVQDGKRSIVRSSYFLAAKPVQELLGQSVGTWLENLESFPGPFGRVDQSTTEALLEYLEKMASKFDEGDIQYCTLESATKFPESAAIACRFLCCLVRANGTLQAEFWKHFSPVLASAKALLQGGKNSSKMRRFSARLCKGEINAALEEACSEGLWSHALAASRLLAPQSCDMVLLKFVEAVKQGKEMEATSNLSEEEMEAFLSPFFFPIGEDEKLSTLEDPSIQALLLLYECLSKGSVPEITEKVLSGWPAFAAMFSLLLRPGEYRDVAISFLELASKGDIFAGHVCYLMTGERTLDAVDAPSSLVCIFGVEHRSPKNFSRLLDPLALQLSEAYEYALRCGNADALCPTIQPFKLAHAMLLADMGLTEKARRYMVLLQAFVKAVPQNRLSDAFRSSMREFNEVLNPNMVVSGQPQEAPRVGKMVKDFVRGFAETTGLSVKPIAPPALPAEDEQEESQSQSQPFLPGGFQAARPLQPVQPFQAPPRPEIAPSAPLANVATNPIRPANPFPSAHAEIGGFAPGSNAAFAPVASPGDVFGGNPGGGPMPPQVHRSAYPPAEMTMAGHGQGMGSAPFYDNQAESQDQPKRPDRMDFSETVENDPFVNAGKAMLGFGKSLFSALKQGNADGRGDDRTEQKPKGFYYNKEKGRWMEHGKEEQEQEDISEYDPMTGKKITKAGMNPKFWLDKFDSCSCRQVAEPPPPPPGGCFGGPPMGGPPMGGPPMGGPPMGGPPMGGPPMGGPPMGGPPMGGPPSMGGQMDGPPQGNPYSGAALGRNAASASSLYVNPMAPAPPMGAPMGAPPGGGAMLAGPCGVPGGALNPFSNQVGPRSSPFG